MSDTSRTSGITYFLILVALTCVIASFATVKQPHAVILSKIATPNVAHTIVQEQPVPQEYTAK